MKKALLEGRPRLAALLLAGGAACFVLLVLEGSGAAAQGELPLPAMAHRDKLLHFGAHLWITSLLLWGLALLGSGPARGRVLRALAMALALDLGAGLAIELAQATMGAAHGRVFDLWDVAANAAGALAAGGLFLVMALRLTRA